MKLALATLAAVAVTASACTPAGQRAIGAPGYSEVPYVGGCCDRSAPVAKAGDWGLFCAGGGNAKTCYGAGERAIGASGNAAVPYLPCCDGSKPVAKAGDWGLFCGAGTASGGSGAAKTCYKDGERAIGADGHPAVPHLKCCSGAEPAAKAGDWGLFCGGGSSGGSSGSTGTLAEGEQCGTATALSPAPALGKKALSGGVAKLCAEGLSCQWRADSQTHNSGASIGRVYYCRPLPKQGECYATISAQTKCFSGTECDRGGSSIPFTLCSTPN
jgi:hypothetical protein